MRQAILDTDTISFFFRGDFAAVTKVNQYLKENDQLNISIISYYEVLYGLYYKDAKKQLPRFLDFVAINKVIPLTQTSARISAKIAAELRDTGQEIGHNDTLIAGIALENDFVLITNNNKHFSRIKNLEIDNWVVIK